MIIPTQNPVSILGMVLRFIVVVARMGLVTSICNVAVWTLCGGGSKLFKANAWLPERNGNVSLLNSELACCFKSEVSRALNKNGKDSILLPRVETQLDGSRVSRLCSSLDREIL